MPLPQFYRIIPVNNTGQTLTYDNNGRINVKITGVKWNPSTGVWDYANLGDDDCGFGAGDSTTDAGEDLSSEIDNTTNKYDHLHVQLEITHDEGTAADGPYDVYLDGGDAAGELSSDASGYAGAEANGLRFVGSLTWESNGLDDEVMRSEVIVV
jgi:hypothetical protein